MSDIKEKIISQRNQLEKIWRDDSNEYTNKESAEAGEKYHTLGVLIGDNTVLAGPGKRTPQGKPGANRSSKYSSYKMGGLLEDERIGYAEGTPKESEKTIQSLLEDFRDTFDNMPETLSKDAKKDMEAKVVKDKMNEDKKSFTKYLPLFEMITQTGEYAEGESKAIDIPKRTPKSMGGASMLEDDRQRYAEPDGPVKDEDGFLGHLDVSKEVVDKVIDGDMATVLELASKYKMDVDGLLMEAKIEKNKREEEREGRAEGGPTDMDSDEEMEEDYLDYILDTALTDEEEEMLMSKLEQDGDMSMLFEKVIDVAQEFAGSGPVEGPGSGVSDSIPARLSDGEFVFTAKAVEEIGADKLMAMMKEAEMEADNRQGLVEGGMPEEEKTVTMEVQEQKEPKVQIAKATVDSTRGLLDEDEVSKGIKSKMMLDPLQRHVRS